MSPMTEDQFDRQLRAFLEWQSGQQDGTPSIDEMSARVARRLGTRSAAPPLRGLIWALAILMLLAAAIGLAVFGSQPRPNLIVVVSSSPSPSSSPLAQCALPRTQLRPGNDAPESGSGAVRGPASAQVAIVLNGLGQTTPEAGGVSLAGGGTAGTRSMARVTGGLGRLRALAWSLDGSVLLIATDATAGGGAIVNCGDLYLVKADGSALTQVTEARPLEVAESAALSPDGGSVAYVAYDVASQSGELRLYVAGLTRVIDPGTCRVDQVSWPAGLTWSPDGTSLAVLCGGTVTVYSIADGTSRDFALPAGTEGVTESWSADGRRILVAAPNSGPSQGSLTVVSINPLHGTTAVVSQSNLSVEWVIPFQAGAFSPDGKWLLATGGTPGSVPGSGFQQATYLVEVASGATRQLFSPDGPSEVEWLPDSSGLVFLDRPHGSTVSNPVVRMRVDGTGQTTIGSLPTWGAWHWIGP